MHHPQKTNYEYEGVFVRFYFSMTKKWLDKANFSKFLTPVSLNQMQKFSLPNSWSSVSVSIGINSKYLIS